MAISLTTVTGTANSTSVTTSASITVASGDSLVVGIITGLNTVTVSSVTFNTGSPQSLSAVTNVAVSSSLRMEVWELAAPTAGTATVSATISTTVVVDIIAVCVSGAASGASYRDAAQTNSATASTTASINITSEVGDLALAFIGNRNTNSTWTADASPVSQLAVITSGTGTTHVRLAALSETGAASTSPSGTYGATRDWGAIGFNLNAASSGGTGSLVRGLRAAGIVGPTALVA